MHSFRCSITSIVIEMPLLLAEKYARDRIAINERLELQFET